MQKSRWQQICFYVLATAIEDLGRNVRIPGCDARYFFTQGLHEPWCIAVMLDPWGVLRLLETAGLMEE
jgi:hypothetical protein